MRPTVPQEILLTCVLALVITTGCAHNKGKEALSEDFTVIEGHLAAKPHLERGDKRLIIYLGDRTVLEQEPEPPLTDAVTGEAIEIEDGQEVVEIEPDPVELQPRLTNIRKAVSENTEEEWILRQLKALLSGDEHSPGMKIGPEGPTIRLYGKAIKGKRWQEQVGGVDFFFCYLGYDDAVTGEDTVIDTCYGDRWQDDFFRFMWQKGRDGIKAAPKAVF